ncbi:MAG: hypothetical protein KC458_01625 [Dehalococcoidia bacterium]|nr:hypothetical protein [Dehalococcoidia bacterium]
MSEPALVASQPFIIDGVVSVRLLSDGVPVWAMEAHANGWMQLLLGVHGPGEVDVGMADTLEFDAGLGEPVRRVLSQPARGVSVHRHPVGPGDGRVFVYVQLHVAGGQVADFGDVLHVSSDPLGLLLVRREPMNAYAAALGASESLLERFTSTEDGNDLMAAGALCPFLGMHAWTYRFVLNGATPRGVEVWAGPRLCRRGPYSCAAHGGLDLMLGAGLESWPARTVRPDRRWQDLAWFHVDVHASGPHGVGLGTFVLSPCRPADNIDEPLLDVDPASLFEKVFGDAPDETWIIPPPRGSETGTPQA